MVNLKIKSQEFSVLLFAKYLFSKIVILKKPALIELPGNPLRADVLFGWDMSYLSYSAYILNLLCIALFKWGSN